MSNFKIGDKVINKYWGFSDYDVINDISQSAFGDKFYELQSYERGSTRKLLVNYCEDNYIKILDTERIWQNILNE